MNGHAGVIVAGAGVRFESLAVRVAERDLRGLSAPLLSGEITVSRAGADLDPGDVIILDSTRKGLEALVVRVVEIDHGDGRANGNYTSPSQSGPPVTGIPDAQLFTLDVHIETGSAVNGNVDDFRVSFYVDLSLIGQVLSKNNNLNGAAPVRFDFGGVDFLDGNQRFFLSNVLVSDQDTRGRRFRILCPTGAGTLATAEGGFAELGDGDSATFAYARAVGDAVTSTLTPGASPPGTIGKIILASYVRNAVEVPNPATVVNRLRIAGTDYDATGLSPAGGSIEALSSEWALNPATGVPWTWADLATLEVGFMGDA